MTIKVGSPLWFYPAGGTYRVPAMVTKVWNPTMVNLLADDNGSVFGRTSIAIREVGDSGSDYAKRPEPDDLPDVDRIKADAAYKLYSDDEHSGDSSDSGDSA